MANTLAWQDLRGPVGGLGKLILLLASALWSVHCAGGDAPNDSSDTFVGDIARFDASSRSELLDLRLGDVGPVFDLRSPDDAVVDGRKTSSELSSSDAGPADLPGDVGLSCIKLVECLDACTENDDCPNDCMDAATPEARALFWDLGDCVNPGSWGCNEYECWAPKCLDELYLCFGADGNRSCSESYLCGLELLPEGVVAWAFGGPCVGMKSVDEYGLLLQLELCASKQEACLGPPALVASACAEAVWTSCIGPVTACTSGELSCDDLRKCLFEGLEDNGLVMVGLACIVGGALEEQGLFYDLADCLLDQCGDDATASCVDAALTEECAQQANSCSNVQK